MRTNHRMCDSVTSTVSSLQLELVKKSSFLLIGVVISRVRIGSVSSEHLG
jgi:hypothetical protein